MNFTISEFTREFIKFLGASCYELTDSKKVCCAFILARALRNEYSDHMSDRDILHLCFENTDLDDEVGIIFSMIEDDDCLFHISDGDNPGHLTTAGIYISWQFIYEKAEDYIMGSEVVETAV